MRGPVIAGAVAALACAGLAATVLVLTRGRSEEAGSGDIGTVEVYGQTKKGPAKLPAGRRVALPRPQDFAFQFTAEGSGPRFIRVEIDTQGEVSVMYEKKHFAPKFKDSLGYTMRLSEDAPDELTIVVTLEAPHAQSRTARYPVRLIGADSPFWEEP